MKYKENHTTKSTVALGIGLILLWIAAAVGWVSNLIWLFAGAEGSDVEFVIALAGIFLAPLGVIHGWFILF